MTGDVELRHFDSNVTHDQVAMIPLIKAAMQKNKQQGRQLVCIFFVSVNHLSRKRLCTLKNLFLTPWSPPGWMKANDKMTGSFHPGLRNDSASEHSQNSVSNFSHFISKKKSS